MKVRLSVKTEAANSEVLKHIEIDDDVLRPLSVIDKKQLIEDVCFQNMLTMLKWEWEIVNETPKS